MRVSSNRDAEPLALDAFESLAVFVLRMEDAPDAVELSVALVDPDEIAKLNLSYRGVEGPTDVLSFGCDDPEPVDSDEPIAIGDVVIAPEIAQSQAVDLGTTVESELDLLLVHGVLHLLGYDHDSDEDAAVMQARERAVLAAWANAER
ncbi:MAG TPA: rRNA maturation RNase YbeY [Coriobacteriia bacterium]